MREKNNHLRSLEIFGTSLLTNSEYDMGGMHKDPHCFHDIAFTISLDCVEIFGVV